MRSDGRLGRSSSRRVFKGRRARNPRKDLETMNPDTGAIAAFEKDDDAKAAGYTVPLTDKEARKLAGMNRHDRRAWLSRKRKADRGKVK
jgi:hypothetical protein